MNSGGGIIIVILIFGGLIPVFFVAATYNRFIRLRQHIRESWADIDVELKRRYELIPNLVEVVKGYAKHERTVLESVIELRNKARANEGTAESQAVDEASLLAGLKQVFVVAERYPQLKADANYLALQRELANTEDRIAAARRFYNANVREMNQLRQTFPTSLVGSAFKVESATFFELSSEAERVVPRANMEPITQPAMPG
ncbi:MAG: LemA family protein [Phycisphaerales bacterium]